MPNTDSPNVAILDYGLGNLFSVKHACGHAGINAIITSAPEDIAAADAVIMPGMGAFGDAMDSLRRLDLISPLKDVVDSGKPLIGICLGLQLLMRESHEFGTHEGLGFVEGSVVSFDAPVENSIKLKVPQIQWNKIRRNSENGNGGNNDPWVGSLLEGLSDGEHMYFVHSFYVKPDDPAVILSKSQYGQFEFCSSLNYKNIFACQFHPERSGPEGLKVYRNLATLLKNQKKHIGASI